MLALVTWIHYALSKHVATSLAPSTSPDQMQPCKAHCLVSNCAEAVPKTFAYMRIKTLLHVHVSP